MTQSGGQAAGIQLQVGLDLAYFRNQLPLLSKEAAGHSLAFGVRFNRQDIVTQFRTLDRYVNNKNFNIEIKSNLKAEIKAAKELSNLLKSMPAGKPGTPGAIYNRTAGTEVRTAALNKLLRSPGAGGFDATQIKKLAEAAIKAGIEGIDINASATKLRSTLRDAFQQAGDDSSRGLINALTNGRTVVGKAAAGLAEETLNALRTSLQTQSPSKKTEKIGRDAGKGFEIGSVDAMNDAFDALEALTGRRLRRLKSQFAEGARGALAISSGQVSRVSVSDVTPRNFERIAGSSIRGALPPGVDRSAETLQDFYRSLDQIGIALASTIDSSERAADAFKTLRNALDSLIDRAKILASEQSLQARLRPSSVPSGMPLLTGRAPGRALPMLPAAAQRPERFTSQEKLFKDFLGRTIKAVIPESGSAAIGRSLFGGTQFREIGNAMRRPQLGAGIDTKVETVAVKDLTLASRNIAAATDALKAQILLPAAGGTSASQMIRQVLSGLPPLKAPRIGAQNISPRGSLGQFPMEGMAYPSSSIGSMGRFPMDPMLAVGGASAVGQKIAGPYPFSNTARSARGGYFPGISSSLRFPMEGMIGPSSPIDRITPQSSMFGAGGPPGGPPRPPSGGGGMGGAGSFGRAFGGINLPGAGVVREIGNEFAMATKQVLLFGTAYKALAFFTSFPAEVGQAVGALQSFNNTLKAISPTADEARASNQFILDTVDRYNVPLQSARDGFTKLYASMAPAGFKGDEIRALFTGVSQAAATFGMSADKVDRVNYAFAQMASKGQVMSEELKGQLGDVLPGAMGIFAKAAGFEGPDAIQKFSKALEDGEYKGKAMRDLLKNVTTELKKEFGPGAEGAAKTFQGSINRMQNSTKLLYEAFEPAAVGFLNSVVVPLTGGLKTITEGVKAYFQGQKAATPEAESFNNVLKTLVPSLNGIAQNIGFALQQLLPLGQILGSVILQITRFLALPLVGYLAGTYLQVVLLTSGFKLLATSGIGLALVSLARFIAQGAIAASVMLKLQVATQQTTVATHLFGQAVQTVMIKSVVGIALVAISTLISKIMELCRQLSAIGNNAKGMEDLAKSSARMGDVLGTKEAIGNIKNRLATFKELQKQLKDAKKISGGSMFDDRGAISESYEISTALASKLVELGVVGAKALTKTSGGYSLLADNMGTVNALVDKNVNEFTKAGQKGNVLVDQAIRKNKELKAQVELPGEEAEELKKENLSQYANLQDQLAKNFTQDQLQRMEREYQARVDRINSEFDLREARANSFQKEAIRFERQMSDIELKRQKALLDASAEVIRAQGSVAGGAGAGGKGLGAGIAQYITGDPASPFYKADHGGDNYHEHLAFVSREAAEEAYRKLTGAGIQVTEFKGKSRVGRHTPGSAHYEGLAFDVPGAQVPVGQETKLTARVQSILGIGSAGAPRKVTADEKRDVIADQKTQLALAQQSLTVQLAEAQAIRDAAVAWAQYTAAIVPIEEQALQNDILSKKNELVKASLPEDVIEKELKYFEAQQKTTLARAANDKLLKDGLIDEKQHAKNLSELQTRLAGYNTELDRNIQLQRQQKFDASLQQLKDQVAALRIIGDEERRLFELRKEYGSDEEAQKIFDLEKIKKNIEDARALIDGFVSQTSSDYKGFLKAVISGEDAADALKQFQEGLKDRVLTIFLDFAMAPVEKFLKESLEGLFLPKAPKELKPEEEKAKTGIEGNTVATDKNTVALDNVTAALTGAAGQNQSASTASALPKGFGMSASLGSAINATDYSSVFKEGSQALTASLTGVFADLSSALDASAYSLSESAVDYSDSFKDIGDNAKDMAKETGEAAEEAGKNGDSMKEALGKTAAGIGIAAGAIMGIAAGISQIKEGGTANVLGGIGSILLSVGGAIGGFASLFKAANGAVWKGGFQAFANGGTVTGPTLGLVGEGKYNEAIVPLPDGRSIPVQMRGGASRDLLNAPGSAPAAPTMLSMSFQSTTINGVEYVDRAQLEAAMAETRKSAARDGASRGASLALDRLQNSPSTRRRVGIR